MMAKYIIAFIVIPLFMVFNLSQMTTPKPWIYEIAGDYWIPVVVGTYYLVVVAAFWLGYLVSRKVQ
ncbi:hypothetical protein D3C87_1262150 [compost metagenome]